MEISPAALVSGRLKRENDTSSSLNLFFVLGRNFLSACEGLLRRSTHHIYRRSRRNECLDAQCYHPIFQSFQHFRSQGISASFRTTPFHLLAVVGFTAFFPTTSPHKVEILLEFLALFFEGSAVEFIFLGFRHFCLPHFLLVLYHTSGGFSKIFLNCS